MRGYHVRKIYPTYCTPPVGNSDLFTVHITIDCQPTAAAVTHDNRRWVCCFFDVEIMFVFFQTFSTFFFNVKRFWVGVFSSDLCRGHSSLHLSKWVHLSRGHTGVPPGIIFVQPPSSAYIRTLHTSEKTEKAEKKAKTISTALKR